jgi:AraC-like DNA-binding protein
MSVDQYLSNIDIRLLKSKKSTLGSYWKIENDNTPYARLYYVKSGSGYLKTHGVEHQLLPGRLYLVPPRGDLAYGFIEDLEIWWVHFEATVQSRIDLFDYLTYEIEIEPDDTETIESNMTRLIELARSSNISSQIAGNGILLEMLSLFLKNAVHQMHTEANDKLDRFTQVIEHIEAHLNEKITTSQLARIANFERSHFSVVFKKLFDISPTRYINKRRVDNVQFLLQTTSKTLAELAGECGFTDAFHLSKTFKQYTGHSPKEFRAMKRELMP